MRIFLICIQSQEYSVILDEGDKQIDGVYMRRLKNAKRNKKRASESDRGCAPTKDVPENVLSLIQRRLRLEKEVGVVFEGLDRPREGLFE